jgi:uncharacterized protein YciW
METAAMETATATLSVAERAKTARTMARTINSLRAMARPFRARLARFWQSFSFESSSFSLSRFKPDPGRPPRRT